MHTVTRAAVALGGVLAMLGGGVALADNPSPSDAPTVTVTESATETVTLPAETITATETATETAVTTQTAVQTATSTVHDTTTARSTTTQRSTATHVLPGSTSTLVAPGPVSYRTLSATVSGSATIKVVVRSVSGQPAVTQTITEQPIAESSPVRDAMPWALGIVLVALAGIAAWLYQESHAGGRH